MRTAAPITVAPVHAVRAAVDYTRIALSSLQNYGEGIMFYRWQFSTKPGGHVLPGRSNYAPGLSTQPSAQNPAMAMPTG